jgi:hypothetical protein
VEGISSTSPLPGDGGRSVTAKGAGNYGDAFRDI